MWFAKFTEKAPKLREVVKLSDKAQAKLEKDFTNSLNKFWTAESKVLIDEVDAVVASAVLGKAKPKKQFNEHLDKWWAAEYTERIKPAGIIDENDPDKTVEDGIDFIESNGDLLYDFLNELWLNSRVDSGCLKEFIELSKLNVKISEQYDEYEVNLPTAAEADAYKGKSSNRANPGFKYALKFTQMEPWSRDGLKERNIYDNIFTDSNKKIFIRYV